jgi:hypothetical protein
LKRERSDKERERDLRSDERRISDSLERLSFTNNEREFEALL